MEYFSDFNLEYTYSRCYSNYLRVNVKEKNGDSVRFTHMYIYITCISAIIIFVTIKIKKKKQ